MNGLFEIFEEDQGQAAKQEMRFDAVFVGQVNRTALEMGFQVTEAVFDLPAHMIDPKNIQGGFSFRMLFGFGQQVGANTVKTVELLFPGNGFCVNGEVFIGFYA